MLWCQSNSQSLADFCECLHYFVAIKALDIIAGDLNVDGLQVNVVGYLQLGKEPTQIGSVL